MIIFSKILQIVLALLIVGLVLIQAKGAGLSSSVSSSIGYYGSRRGLEKVVLALTIFSIIALVANSVFLILQN